MLFAQFGAWDRAEQDRFFAETWNANPHEILICDGAPCGYLGVDFLPEEIDLREIVILPEFQGRGLGSTILSELRDRSESARVPVRLRVLQKNRAAALYRRFGFGECGRTSTHFLMQFIPKVGLRARPIYLALHGETEWNQQRRFQGRLDSALTETGIEQARRAGVTLQRVIADATDFLIVTSPLGRARATARLICRTLNIDFARVEIDSRLAEIDLGSWAGLTRVEVEKRWPDLVRGAGRYDWYFCSPDGERFEDLADRLAAWLTAARGRRLLTIAVTHGVASRVLRGVYAGLPQEKASALETTETSSSDYAMGLLTAFLTIVPALNLGVETNRACRRKSLERERTMVTFVAGSMRFTYRVGAIVLREGHVLLTRNLSEDYWFTPGGRVEIGESARVAIEREITEELGVSGRVERLLWSSENFFRMGDTSHHEIALYFLVTLPDLAHPDLSATFHCEESDGTRFEFAWHRVDALGGIRLVPGFLINALANVPEAPQHIVHIDASMHRAD